VSGQIRMQSSEHALVLSFTYISCLALEIQGLCDFVSGKSSKSKRLLFHAFSVSLWLHAKGKEMIQIGYNFSRVFVVCVCVCVSAN
jgi:hypothetical protein